MLDAMLTWLGGGEPRDVGERHERSSYALAGVVVAVNAVLAWLVAAGAVAASTNWSYAVIVPLCLVFGLLVGAVTRAVAVGDPGSSPALAGRAVVAIAVGAVVGELAAILLLSGAIDRRIDEQSASGSTAAPVVVRASAELDRARGTRTALDTSVDQARDRRDEALVVARCEYNPSPACPQTRITGVPGSGPETRTANELLAGAQQELDNALAARDGATAELDAAVAAAGQRLDQARAAAVAEADRGLGARWVAMNGYTLSNFGALLLRLAATTFFALLTALPLILRLWRGETSQDRVLAARAVRQRAELEADTAISVAQAEVRASAGTLWAEQQLTNARLAVQAQTEIDREHHRRRVIEAVGASIPPLKIESVEDDMYLPIAAEAEAASLAPAQLPGVVAPAAELPSVVVTAAEGGALPATVKPAAERGHLIPAIPLVTKAAGRWIRPLVPPIVSRVIDTATQPVRAARQAFEEVEEITFSFKRVHKVTLQSEEPAAAPAGSPEVIGMQRRMDRVDAAFDRPGETTAYGERMPIGRGDADSGYRSTGSGHDGQLGVGGDRPGLSERKGPRELDERKGPRELDERKGPRELDERKGPRELPPAE